MLLLSGFPATFCRTAIGAAFRTAVLVRGKLTSASNAVLSDSFGFPIVLVEAPLSAEFNFLLDALSREGCAAYNALVFFWFLISPSNVAIFFVPFKPSL